MPPSLGLMCDCLVALGAATRDGHTLFAKNSDRPPAEVQVLEWFEPRIEHRTTTTYLDIEPHDDATIRFLGSRPSWMWGVEHGVNEAGVAAGNATIYTTLDPRGMPDALTGMDLVRLALERASTAIEAVQVVTDLVGRHGQGGSGHEGVDRPYWSSFLVADPQSAFVIDTSGKDFAVERVERTRATSNRTTIPFFDRVHRHPRQPVDKLVDPRLAASNDVLDREPLSVDALAAHLRAHVGGDDGYTVCMHVPGVEVTRASIIAELRPDGPPWVWTAQGSPCATEYTRSW
jgi:secernin